jgi:hypothetical protein
MIGIFGGSGYIGQEFVRLCEDFHIEVEVLNRETTVYPRNVSCVVDFSFPSRYRDDLEVGNYLEIYKSRLKNSREIGIPYYYIGSYSSQSPRLSEYGKLKKVFESFATEFDATIIRAGLVVDLQHPGGRFQQLVKLLRIAPCIPVFPSDWCPLQITFLDDLLGSLILLSSELDRSTKREVIEVTSYRTNLSDFLISLDRNKSRIHLSEKCTRLLAFVCGQTSLGAIDNLNSIFVKE